MIVRLLLTSVIIFVLPYLGIYIGNIIYAPFDDEIIYINRGTIYRTGKGH